MCICICICAMHVYVSYVICMCIHPCVYPCMYVCVLYCMVHTRPYHIHIHTRPSRSTYTHIINTCTSEHGNVNPYLYITPANMQITRSNIHMPLYTAVRGCMCYDVYAARPADEHRARRPTVYVPRPTYAAHRPSRCTRAPTPPLPPIWDGDRT